MDGSEQLNISVSRLFPGKTFIATQSLREAELEDDGEEAEALPSDGTFFELSFHEGSGATKLTGNSFPGVVLILFLY